MDRRNFFKTVLVTPFLTPLLLASKKTKSDLELFLIADDPQLFFPLILEELQKYAPKYSNDFSILNSHPQEDELKRTLTQKGWKYVQNPFQTGWTFSFSHLHHRAFPSFTLVREGKIWDIRFRRLFSCWHEMNKNHKPSFCLTIASLKNTSPNLLSGKFMSVYRDGRKIDTIPLRKNTSKSYKTKRGKIAVRVKDGSARVLESPCRHKICLHSPPISFVGERIICTPNHFLLEIQGSNFIDTAIG